MKAIIKTTGEIVEVTPAERMQISCGSFIAQDGRKIPSTALEFEKPIDWEQRRYEIAKDVFVATFIDPDKHSLTIEADAELAVEAADALIEELKKGGIG